MPTCQTGVLVEIHSNVYDPGQIQKDLYGDIKGINFFSPPPPPPPPPLGLPVCTNTLFHWMHFSHCYS